MVDDPGALVSAYLNGEADQVMGLREQDIPPGTPVSEQLEPFELSTGGLILIPTQPPLDDIRIRRAIAHALDRKDWSDFRRWGERYTALHGGIVPRGMAGHSPELGLPFDLERAQRLLAEAGYPGGKGFPVLKLYFPGATVVRVHEDVKRQLAEGLGIVVETEAMPPGVPWWRLADSHMMGGAWVADFPDPHNFLGQSSFYRILKARGWQHAHLDNLLEEAAHTTDRARRLAMYREADRILVNEEVVTYPVSYSMRGGGGPELKKPWVQGLRYNALGYYSLKEIVIG
jgi:ABC-type transport system substrate-binding protein